MPKRCVLGGCSNTSKDGVMLHKFPKEEKLRNIWTRYVQKTRTDFHTSTSSSVLCSSHFSQDCYDPSHLIKKKLGFPYKKDLLPGKYPTIKPLFVASRSNGDVLSTPFTLTELTEDDYPNVTTNIRETYRFISENCATNEVLNTVGQVVQTDDTVLPYRPKGMRKALRYPQVPCNETLDVTTGPLETIDDGYFNYDTEASLDNSCWIEEEEDDTSDVGDKFEYDITIHIKTEPDGISEENYDWDIHEKNYDGSVQSNSSWTNRENLDNNGKHTKREPGLQEISKVDDDGWIEDVEEEYLNDCSMYKENEATLIREKPEDASARTLLNRAELEKDEKVDERLLNHMSYALRLDRDQLFLAEQEMRKQTLLREMRMKSEAQKRELRMKSEAWERELKWKRETKKKRKEKKRQQIEKREKERQQIERQEKERQWLCKSMKLGGNKTTEKVDERLLDHMSYALRFDREQLFLAERQQIDRPEKEKQWLCKSRKLGGNKTTEKSEKRLLDHMSYALRFDRDPLYLAEQETRKQTLLTELRMKSEAQGRELRINGNRARKRKQNFKPKRETKRRKEKERQQIERTDKERQRIERRENVKQMKERQMIKKREMDRQKWRRNAILSKKRLGLLLEERRLEIERLDEARKKSSEARWTRGKERQRKEMKRIQKNIAWHGPSLHKCSLKDIKRCTKSAVDEAIETVHKSTGLKDKKTSPESVDAAIEIVSESTRLEDIKTFTESLDAAIETVHKSTRLEDLTTFTESLDAAIKTVHKYTRLEDINLRHVQNRWM